MDLLVQILLFFIMGILIFYIDGLVGTGLYRGWYNLTHKDPLDPSIQKGFLTNRPVPFRLGWALAFTLIGAGITIVSGSFFNDSTSVALTLMALFVGLILGLLAAPTLIRVLPGRVNKAVNYVDEVESGERKLGDDLKQAATEATKGIAGAAVAGVSKVREAAEEARETAEDAAASITGREEKAKPEPPAEEEPEEKPDWRSGVQDFMDKKK